MKRIHIVVIAMVLATGPLAAEQGRPSPNLSPEVQLQNRRFQFQVMEGVIEKAVRQGAQEVAQEVAVRAEGVMPIGMLFFGRGKARGFPLEEDGVVFYVEIPEIRESAVFLNQLSRPTLVVPSQVGNQPVKSPGAGTTRAAGVVADDPMARSPVTVDPFLADPNQFYRDVIKGKLIDAMLDYSESLKIADSQALTVVARGEEDPIPTSLDDESRALILRIKGSDLALFYSGKITREEARKRVVETQF
jgi:hypothetical protein